MSLTTPPQPAPSTDLPVLYLKELRAHLAQKKPANGDRAQGVGRAALSDGLVALDIALMHEKATEALASSFDFTGKLDDSRARSGFFFTQALIPLEAAQRATRESNRLLRQRNDTLRLHAAELARSNRRLLREIARREAGEATIRKAKSQYAALLVESQTMQGKLRQLTRQIISAQEEERKQISRELHDEVVQTLVGINVQLAALGKGASAGKRDIRSKIARTQRLVEQSVNAVHRFARELRPAVLDDLGLIPALLAHSKIVTARKKLKIRLTAFAGVEKLDNARRTVLFRVAQEALTNVVRHARATCVEIVIRELPGAVRMEIADNGKSFPVQAVLKSRAPKRLGLIGMRERIEMIDGVLTVDSVPGTGTTVNAQIPFQAGER
ncbi:MAG: nreB [Rariglobus sp.]|jgi:signal transduction histidine kinase|nr:nreB [Rariglobus sp.]